METKNNTLRNTSLGVVLALAAASVLLAVPATNAFVSDTKTFVAVFGALGVSVLFVLSSLKKRVFEFTLNPLMVSILFFLVAVLAATFLSSAYPVENLLAMGGVLIAANVTTLLGGSILPKRVVEPVLKTFAITGAALSVLSTLQAVGVGPSALVNLLFPQFGLPNTLAFNLAGSSFVAVQFLAVTLVGLVAYIVQKKHISTVFAVTLPMIVIGMLVLGWSLLPGKPGFMQLPPLNAGWSVALDTIRSPRAALIGVGSGGYSNAYSTFKPVWTNQTIHWSTIYNQAANAPLTLLTTAGFFGLAAWVLLAAKSMKTIKTAAAEHSPLAYMVAATFVLQLFLPLNTVLITIQAVLLAALIAAERDKYSVVRLHALSVTVVPRTQIPAARETNVGMYTGAGVALVVITALLYVTGRSYASFVVQHQAAQAGLKDDAIAVYELQQQAITLNPYYDTFRREFAVTNLLIASALANKSDITEAETTQVGELLQQAVREARSATILDENDSQNWATLANIYSNMVGISEDATEWAVQAYVAAIETNPTDPGLRVQLGNTFVGQEAYGQAASIFQQAVSIKPDFGPSLYSLATTLVRLEDWMGAQAAYNAIVPLLSPEGDEYETIMEELELVNERVAEIQAAQEEQAKAAAEQTGATTTPLGSQITTPSITEQNLNGANALEESSNLELDLPAAKAIPEDSSGGDATQSSTTQTNE